MGYTPAMVGSREEAYNKLITAQRVAISISTPNSADVIHATQFLCKHLKDNQVDFTLFISGEVSDLTKKILEDNQIPFQLDAKPLSYVISIDYGSSGIDKVTYDRDEKNQKLNFYITPAEGEFNFDNVAFKQEGANYDLSITIGVKALKDLGDLYENNRHLYSDLDVISIFNGSGNIGDYSVTVPESSSLLYAVRTLIGDAINPDSAQYLIELLVGSQPVLEGVVSDSFYKEALELMESGANLQSAFSNKYYKKEYSNLDLQIKLMHNVKVDRKNRVVWSKLSLEDLRFCGINRTNIDLRGRIIFNISDAFDIAFAVFETEKDTLMVLVESNSDKYSASNIAGVFGGEGDQLHAQCEIKNMQYSEFEKKFFMVLKDMYSVDVQGESVGFRSSASST